MKVYVCYSITHDVLGPVEYDRHHNEIVFRHKSEAEEWVRKMKSASHKPDYDDVGYDELELDL